MSTAEAAHKVDAGEYPIVVPTSLSFASGEVRQLPDGRAGVYNALRAATAGDRVAMATTGGKIVQKTTGLVILKGVEVFFDRATNLCTPLPGNGRFRLGVAMADAASAATEVLVDINARPSYQIALGVDAFDTVLVANGAMTILSGKTRLAFTTAAEAQKADLLSQAGIAAGTPFIVVGRLAIVSQGDNAALDFNIGIANGTHASDADTITESAFLHLDGNTLDLKAESDDGTTEVAATDTTVDAVASTPFQFWLDMRTPADPQLYINAVNVLPDSVFNVAAAVGPWKLLAHLEKSSDDTPGSVEIMQLAAIVSDAA